MRMPYSASMSMYWLLIPLMLLFSANLFLTYGTVENVNFEVIKTERVVESNSDGSVNSKYLVWGKTADTETIEVFSNTDSFLWLKFNSSDIQGNFLPEKICVAKVNGYRIPLLSMYRNILEGDCNNGRI